ncbi:unnamed protein product [Clavelina lepadiformis]|uniref:Uncharacterized protein n=1 Tax=Clavelina lepadiformis TaxID=159417 RepID=A0ABP0FN09_CLALP
MTTASSWVNKTQCREEKSGQLPQATYVPGTDAPARTGSIGLWGGAVVRIFWIVCSEIHVFAI